MPDEVPSSLGSAAGSRPSGRGGRPRPAAGRAARHRGWRLGGAAAIAGVLIAAGGFAISRVIGLRARLLTASPDRILEDPLLGRYAIALGRPAYAAHCAACHGPDLAGDSRRGIPNLADRDWLYGTGRVIEIERVILYGIRSGDSKAWNLARMPAYARAVPYREYPVKPLRPGEIDDVAAFIAAFRRPFTDAAAVARGSAVFHGDGMCVDCHGEDARGDPGIGAPDLTDGIWLYGDGSHRSIAESIAYGLGGTCPPWSLRLPAATIRAIAVYVRSAADARAELRAGTPAGAGAQAIKENLRAAARSRAGHE